MYGKRGYTDLFFHYSEQKMMSVLKEYVQREHFRQELKDALSPVLTLMADESRPYFTYALIFVAAHFILLGCICFHLVNLKKYALKIYEK
jgi:hypothetical protein